jgi:hypothetical protein
MSPGLRVAWRSSAALTFPSPAGRISLFRPPGVLLSKPGGQKIAWAFVGLSHPGLEVNLQPGGVMSSKLHRNALRQARRFLELHLGHRLDRFRSVAGSAESLLGYEYHAACRDCQKACVVFFPLTSEVQAEGFVRTTIQAGRTRIFVIGGRATAARCLADSRSPR